MKIPASSPSHVEPRLKGTGVRTLRGLGLATAFLLAWGSATRAQMPPGPLPPAKPAPSATPSPGSPPSSAVAAAEKKCNELRQSLREEAQKLRQKQEEALRDCRSTNPPDKCAALRRQLEAEQKSLEAKDRAELNKCRAEVRQLAREQRQEALKERREEALKERQAEAMRERPSPSAQPTTLPPPPRPTRPGKP